MPTFNFVGLIPSWVDPETEGWSFLEASVIFGTEGLSVDAAELVRQENAWLKDVKEWKPEYSVDSIIPSRPLTMPNIQDVWWEGDETPYRSRATPYLLKSLLNGVARAFGDTDRPGATPEWIAPRAWWGLKPNQNDSRLFHDGINTYWHVRVVDREAFLSQMEIEANNNQDASSPVQEGSSQSVQEVPKLPVMSKGGRTPSEKFYAFAREMVRKADLDRLPDSEGPTFNYMQDWCDGKFPDGAPGESTIRDWLAKLDYRKPEHSQESSS